MEEVVLVSGWSSEVENWEIRLKVTLERGRK